MVRHAQTAWNAQGLLQGHTDVPLNDVGRDQARRLGERLSHVGLDAAHSSDLLRCTQTLEPLVAGRDLNVSYTKLLREHAFGRWEGMSFSAINAAYPELYAQMVEDYTAFTPPGGENFRGVEARSAAFASEVRERHAPDNASTLLVLGHGAALRTLITSLTGLPLDAGWRFKMDSCSLTVLDVNVTPALVVLLNDTSHLGNPV